MAERDRAIRWLHGEVATRDQTISELHREVADRDQMIRRLRDQAGGTGEGAGGAPPER